MAQLQNGFDATKVDPTQGVPSLPVGKHPVVIVDSDIKENKEKTGGFAEFIVEIIDGPAKGSKGAYRLNLYHSNAQTVEIAYRQLSALCHVCGVYQIQDTRQLHNIPFIIDVELQKGEEAKAKGYTQVARVFDKNGNEPGKQSHPPANPQPTQGGGGGAPWGTNQGQAATAQQPAQGGGAPWGQGTGQPAGGAPAGSGWGGNPQQAGNGGGAPSSGGGTPTPPWGTR